MWHSRQVRRLLNIIDRLPPNSHTNAAISNDDEHVKMLVEAGLKAAPGVSQVYYGSVEQRLDTAIDAMHRVGDLIVAVNSKKGKRNPPSKPQPRPKSAFTRIKHETRMAQHNALTARVLPNGPQPEEPRKRVAGERRRDRRLLDGTAVVAPGGANTFERRGHATRDDERQARWRERELEVGRVPQSSDPAT